jgi:hypothetical protein
MFLGLRTVIYPPPDLAASKAWYTAVLGAGPYFYVGFTVAGYELALDPNADPAAGPVTDWGVPDTSVAIIREPCGAVLGIIENPHVQLDTTAPASPGPGR